MSDCLISKTLERIDYRNRRWSIHEYLYFRVGRCRWKFFTDRKSSTSKCRAAVQKRIGAEVYPIPLEKIDFSISFRRGSITGFPYLHATFIRETFDRTSSRFFELDLAKHNEWCFNRKKWVKRHDQKIDLILKAEGLKR